LPDATGTALVNAIAAQLQAQVPVVIVGKGGSGKSTLLCRWAFLALHNSLPESLEVSSSRAKLYERYFRRLLRVESAQLKWDGWRIALENLAHVFVIVSGNRGVGIAYEPLMRIVQGSLPSAATEEPLLSRLSSFYHLKFEDGAELLQALESAGLLQSGRRWRFSHDSFEEYFAASWRVSWYAEIPVEDLHRGPSLEKWVSMPAKVTEFFGVIGFVAEMAGMEVRRDWTLLDWPAEWNAIMDVRY
jgi:energy-coupling factor transporter ATP-binding protein EcfA2